MSDLHFGKKGYNMAKDSKAFKAFFKDMDELKAQYGDLDFVLAGDIFDLWRAYAKDCIPEAKDFFTKMDTYTGKTGKVVFIPGNHDHYIKQKLFGKKLNGTVDLSAVKPGDSDSLKALKDLGVEMKIVYPDYNINMKGEDVKITHGHFFNEEVGNAEGYIVSLLVWISLSLQILVPSKRVQEWIKCFLYPTIFKWAVRTFSGSGKPYMGKIKTQKESKFKGWMRNKVKLLQLLVDLRMDAWGEDCDLLIAGHTHVPGYATLQKHRQDRRYVSDGCMTDGMATYITVIDGEVRIRNAGKPAEDVAPPMSVRPPAPGPVDPDSWPARLKRGWAGVKRFMIYGVLMIFGEVSFYTIVRTGRTIPLIRYLFQFDWFVDKDLYLSQVWTAPIIVLYGQASLWMFLVYGWAIFFGVEIIYRRLRWLPIPFRLVLYGAVICFWECLWGWFLLWVTGYSIWEYGDPLTVFRYTSLAIFPLWCILGLLAEKALGTIEKLSMMEFRLDRIRRGKWFFDSMVKK